MVTIDGPVAAGKSTLAKMVAEQSGYVFLSTGLLYRAVAYKVNYLGLTMFADEPTIMARVATEQIYRFRLVDGESRLFLNEQDHTEELRSDRYSLLASKVSRHQKVREALLKVQQEMGLRGGLVAEGRDTGRVVFPDADLKYFLVADLEFRARMRLGDLLRSGIENVSLEQVREDIRKRDTQDTQGENASLQYVVEDMVKIDTTDRDLREMAFEIVAKIKSME